MRTRKAVVPKAEEEPGEPSSSEANGPASPSLSTCMAEQGRSMTSKAGRFCHKKYQRFAKGTEKSFKHDFIFYYIKYTKIDRKNTGVPNTFKGLLLFSLIVFHLIVQISGCRFCLLFILCLVFRFYSYNCSFVCYLLFYFDRLFYVFYSVLLSSATISQLLAPVCSLSASVSMFICTLSFCLLVIMLRSFLFVLFWVHIVHML